MWTAVAKVVGKVVGAALRNPEIRKAALHVVAAKIAKRREKDAK